MTGIRTGVPNRGYRPRREPNTTQPDGLAVGTELRYLPLSRPLAIVTEIAVPY